jgi:type IV pilus assembly protein PilX
MNIPVTSYKKQRGVVIVVALVMLLAMTILSVTSMTNSTLEEKMSANLRDREIALQAAEAALRYGERLAPTIAKGDFNCGCNSGHCNFDIENPGTCDLTVEYWTDAGLDVWNDTDKHISYNVTFSEVSTQPKLIIEYMGRQMQDLDAGVWQTGDPPVFRITAMGYGQTSTTRVMLQSTYIP